MRIQELDPKIPAHRLKSFVSQYLAGRCEILSKGADCTCPLCDLDRLYATLRWYEERAGSVVRYLEDENSNAVTAVVTELSLDAGKRSIAVLGK